jgi:hypothetical protein
VRDSANNIITQTIMPRFNQKESVVRYTSLFNMFLDKIDKKINDDGNKYGQYLNIVVQQIAKNVKKDYPNAGYIEATLCLYDYPSLNMFKHGDRTEKLIPIYKYKE